MWDVGWTDGGSSSAGVWFVAVSFSFLCLDLLILAFSLQPNKQANLPYVLFIAAFNTTFLLGYLAIQLFFQPDPSQPSNTRSPPPAVPPLLAAANTNAQLVFLAVRLLVNRELSARGGSVRLMMLALGQPIDGPRQHFDQQPRDDRPTGGCHPRRLQCNGLWVRLGVEREEEAVIIKWGNQTHF